MLIQNQYHLSYCTNVHPGETWYDTFEALKENIPIIKLNVSPKKDFGIGLRLSNRACIDLLQGRNMGEFKKWMDNQNCYVYTLNGFSYGSFHHTKVKDKVHSPDWTHIKRLNYSKRLATILAQLLPENIKEGSISTSPLSYKFWHPTTEDKHKAFVLATENLVEMVMYLRQLHRETGKFIHLNLEPEPDGLLENTKEVIRFFRDYLIPIGTIILQDQYRVGRYEADRLMKDFIRVCLDVCHVSMAYESPLEAVTSLINEGIKIGKVQLSAALKSNFTKDAVRNMELIKTITTFEEPTYLHQVSVLQFDYTNKRYKDLSEALSYFDPSFPQEWRIHFHVPIFLSNYGELDSTQKEILEVLELLKHFKFCNHLEVETYTWDVLPKDIRFELKSSISKELRWVKEQMDSPEKQSFPGKYSIIS